MADQFDEMITAVLTHMAAEYGPGEFHVMMSSPHPEWTYRTITPWDRKGMRRRFHRRHVRRLRARSGVSDAQD